MASIIVGLAGYAGTGKSTAAEYLREAHGFTVLSFAEPLREALLTLNPIIDSDGLTLAFAYEGWDGDWRTVKDEYPVVRELLQRLGTDVGRNMIDPDIWVNMAMRKAEAIVGPVVFDDVRFPNEVHAIVHARGRVWRTVRTGVGPANGHESESALDDFLLPPVRNHRDLNNLHCHLDIKVAPLLSEVNA